MGDKASRHISWKANGSALRALFAEVLTRDASTNWNVTLDDLETSVGELQIELICPAQLPFLCVVLKANLLPESIRDSKHVDAALRISVPFRNYLGHLTGLWSGRIPSAGGTYTLHIPVPDLAPLISCIRSLEHEPSVRRDKVLAAALPAGLGESMTLTSHFVLATNSYLVMGNATTMFPADTNSPALVYLGSYDPLAVHAWPTGLRIPTSPSRFGQPGSGLEVLLCTSMWLESAQARIADLAPPSLSGPRRSVGGVEEQAEELVTIGQQLWEWERDLSNVKRFAQEAITALADQQYQDCNEIGICDPFILAHLPPASRHGYLSMWADSMRRNIERQENGLTELRRLMTIAVSSHANLASLKSTRAIRRWTIATVLLALIALVLSALQLRSH